jgi:hypothetical protein
MDAFFMHPEYQLFSTLFLKVVSKMKPPTTPGVNLKNLFFFVTDDEA